MTAVLGINAVFHDPAAALVVDGHTVAAAEEERFSRRKHGKACVPFSTWELPEHAIAWCLRHAGLRPDELDAIGYSYDPALAPAPGDITADEWEGLRTLYVERAPRFLQSLGFDPAQVRFVAHHVAHAAAAHLATALRTPSVVLFGPNSPARWGPPPERREHRVLWAGRHGDPNGTSTDPGLMSLQPRHVLEAMA